MKPSKCAVLCLLVITVSISPVVAQDQDLPMEEKLYGLSLVWQEAVPRHRVSWVSVSII